MPLLLPPPLLPPPIPSPPSDGFTVHRGYNCYDGKGASEWDGSDLENTPSLSDCKAACLTETQCGGVVMGLASGSTCYRRADIRIDECEVGSTTYSTYTLIRPPAPPMAPQPLTPPPFAPHSAAMRVAARLNDRFVHGHPSAARNSKPYGAGVVMHQFDNFEANGRPWAPCDGSWQYKCKGGSFAGRMSTMIVFKSMHERRDRVAVPLIGWGGGIVVAPDIKVKCAYGDDGSTYRANGGCYDNWCDPGNPWRGGNPCGFGGANTIDHAWHSYHLSSMLELYNKHSQHYRSPQFYSGYNELVYDAHDWNSHLPHTVEAFFGLFTQNGYNPNGATARQHRAFLQQYGVSDQDIPLLDFDPRNWNAPFSPVGHSHDTAHERTESLPRCPDWCARWHCDGAAWCVGGDIPAPCKNCER